MWQRIKDTLRRAMYGRYGSDKLGRTLIITGLILWLIAAFTKIGLLSWIGLALYFWEIFRMFSRNVQKRAEENQKYLQRTEKVRTSYRQAKNRARNSKQYKYFRCPKCRSYLKLPRNVGEVTVTCGKCRNQFRKKA